MKYLEKLEELIQEQHGTILSSDLDLYEIPRVYLQMMVAEGEIDRVERGVYVSADSIEDEMYARQTKYSKLIYSHETALFFMAFSIERHLSTPTQFQAAIK